jgi:hypothetical protein
MTTILKVYLAYGTEKHTYLAGTNEKLLPRMLKIDTCLFKDFCDAHPDADIPFYIVQQEDGGLYLLKTRKQV